MMDIRPGDEGTTRTHEQRADVSNFAGRSSSASGIKVNMRR